MHPVEDRKATTQVTPDRVHHIKTAMEKEKPSALCTVTPHQGPGMITGLGTTLAPNFVIGPSYGELYCGSFGVLQSKF